MTMKRINGEAYRKVKGHADKVWWVRMSPEEITENRLYNLGLVVAPTLVFLVWCWAAGIFG